MEKNKNLKEIIKSLISFSLPLILSGVLQQLYNWVDAFIVGNANGEISLAAIGSTTTPINFFITIITGFSMIFGSVFVFVSACGTVLSYVYMQEYRELLQQPYCLKLL